MANEDNEAILKVQGDVQNAVAELNQLSSGLGHVQKQSDATAQGFAHLSASADTAHGTLHQLGQLAKDATVPALGVVAAAGIKAGAGIAATSIAAAAARTRLEMLSASASGVVTSGLESVASAAQLAADAIPGVSIALGLTATAAAAATYAYHQVSQGLDEVTAAAIKAKALQIPTDDLLALSRAARVADVSNETLSSGITSLTGKLRDAIDPSSKTADIFRILGITIDAGTAPAVLKLADAVKGIDDPLLKMQLATALGISPEFIRMLEKGSAGLQEFQDRTTQTRDALKNAATATAETAAEVATMKGQLEETRQAAAAPLTEAIALLHKQLTDLKGDLLISTPSFLSVETHAAHVFGEALAGPINALTYMLHLMEFMGQTIFGVAQIPPPQYGAQSTIGGGEQSVQPPFAQRELYGALNPPAADKADKAEKETAAVDYTRQLLEAQRQITAALVALDTQRLDIAKKTGAPLDEMVALEKEITAQKLAGIDAEIKILQEARAAEEDQTKAGIDQAKIDALAIQRRVVELQQRLALLAITNEGIARQHTLNEAQTTADQGAAERARFMLDVAQREFATRDEQLALAKQLDDAELKVMEDKQADLQIDYAARKAQDDRFGIIQAEDEMLQKIGSQLDVNAQLIARGADNAARLVDQFKAAAHVTVNLADSLASGLVNGDSLRQLTNGIAHAFEAGFVASLLKKNEFDAKINDNFTVQVPGMAAQGASGIVSNFTAGFDLLSGGPGRGREANISDGLGSWVGGPPSYLTGSSAAGLNTTVVGTVLAPGIAGTNAAGSAVTSSGSVLSGIPSGGGISAGGLGGAAATGLTGMLLMSALSGGSGPTGPIGPLATLAMLSQFSAFSGAIGGLAGGFSGLAGSGLGAIGLGGIATSLGLGGAGVGGIAAMQAAELGTPIAAGGGLYGGSAAAGGALGASSLTTAIPIIGEVVAGLVMAYAGSSYVNKLNNSVFGSSKLNDKTLNQVTYSAVLGNSLGKSLGPFLGSALYGFMPLQSLGFNPLTDVLKGLGIAHTPTPDVSAWRMFQQLQGSKGFNDILSSVAPDIGPTSLQGAIFQGKNPGQLASYTGSAGSESKRGSLEGLAAFLLGQGGASPRGPYNTAAAAFASSFIEQADKAGMSATRLQALIDQLAQSMGGTLPKALETLNNDFGNSGLLSPTIQKGYADAVETFTQAFVQDLPNAALESVHKMAEAGQVQIDQLNDFISQVMASKDAVQSAFSASLTALSDQLSMTPEQKAALVQTEAQAELNYQLGQQTHDANIKALTTEIQQAQLLGNTVAEAQLQMQRASEEVALEAAQQAEKQRLADKAAADALATPQGALHAALQKSVSDAIINGVVDALVKQGVVQVALAPMFAALNTLTTALSDPHATQAQIDAAWGAFNSSLSNVPTALSTASNIVNQITPGLTGVLGSITAMASGGIVSRPTLAMVGEAGREAIIPLDRGGALGNVTYNYTFTGNQIMSDTDADRLGRVIARSHMRSLKQNSLLS